MTIPNFITLGRVILVPVVFWLLLNGEFAAAFVGFAIAGASDAIDGFLAKRFNWQSELGAYLDPLADKLLIVCVFIALGVLGKLPSWLVIAVVSRDVLIVAGVLLAWLLGHPMRIQPLLISKATTTAQILLAGAVLSAEGFDLNIGTLLQILIWATAFLTVASLGAYLQTWLRHMSGYESGQGGASAS